MKWIPLLAVSAFLSGCTAIDARPVPASHNMSHVCIKENRDVIVAGFVTALEDHLERHLITTEVYAGAKPRNCEFTLEYTALRSWDFVAYLSYAELKLYRHNSRIGYAEYRLRGKGGFSLMKWMGPKSKMKPVVDQLLAEYALD